MFWKAAILTLSLGLTACSTTGGRSGSALQAFVPTPSSGEPVAAAIVDAMAGGLIGRQLGANLDSRERRNALEAEYKALEYTPAGQAVSWGKAGGRRYGQVVAGSPYRVGSQNCRQYTHSVTMSGQTQSARGTACRNSDGSWTPLA